MNVTNIYNEKFELLLLLKESSPAVISSSSMWVDSINKDRETHGEYVIIFIRICYHTYWNMSSYLLVYVIIFIGIYYHIYWNILSYLLEYVIMFIGICHTIFIGICHHIYLFLNSNSDKNYIQNITSVKNFYEEYLQTTGNTLINKLKTSDLFNIPEFCFIISQYSNGLIFLPINLKLYVYAYICLKI